MTVGVIKCLEKTGLFRLKTTHKHERAGIFDGIEMFYDSRRKHGEVNNIPLLAYEKPEGSKKDLSRNVWSIRRIT